MVLTRRSFLKAAGVALAGGTGMAAPACSCDIPPSFAYSTAPALHSDGSWRVEIIAVDGMIDRYGEFITRKIYGDTFREACSRRRFAVQYIP